MAEKVNPGKCGEPESLDPKTEKALEMQGASMKAGKVVVEIGYQTGRNMVVTPRIAVDSSISEGHKVTDPVTYPTATAEQIRRELGSADYALEPHEKSGFTD